MLRRWFQLAILLTAAGALPVCAQHATERMGTAGAAAGDGRASEEMRAEKAETTVSSGGSTTSAVTPELEESSRSPSAGDAANPGRPQAPKDESATTPATDARDISALLQPIRDKYDLPGLVAAVISGEKLVALGADGVRKRGDPTSITASDLMHLGSCTKSMTATLCALFVEDGKLSWKTTLGEVFADVDMKPAWRTVTLEMLLTHRSGAPHELDKDNLWSSLWDHKGTPVEQRRTLVEGVLENEPEAPPGTKLIYSNAGFAIAGAMLETIAKKPWEELMQERLFRPLGITTAGFGAPGTKGKLDQPLGHSGKKPVEVGRHADNPAAIGPAGTVHMSIADWAKYVALHLEGDRGHARLLKPETFAKLHAVPEGADGKYAMGWSIAERDWAGGRVLTHNGSNTMWFCVTWLAPKKNFAVLVACNQGGDKAGEACDRAAAALIQDQLKLSSQREQ